VPELYQIFEFNKEKNKGKIPSELYWASRDLLIPIFQKFRENMKTAIGYLGLYEDFLKNEKGPDPEYLRRLCSTVKDARRAFDNAGNLTWKERRKRVRLGYVIKELERKEFEERERKEKRGDSASCLYEACCGARASD
jgi:hypothetical protein